MKVYDAPEMSAAVGCIKFVRPNSRVLEFGTGTGYATRFMRDALRCSVTGVECVPEAAEQARPYAEKMIVADVDTGDWTQSLEGLFDFIVFGDVLEHLRDPRLAVDRALRFLSPGGSLLTSVPNVGHNAILLNLRKGRFEYKEYGLLDNTHIHLFTRESLFGMLGELGLYAVASSDNVVRPCLTEFNIHYLAQPFFSLCLVRRLDGDVYQFVNEWKKAEVSELPSRNKVNARRPSLVRAAYEFLYDGAHLLAMWLPPNVRTRLKKQLLR